MHLMPRRAALLTLPALAAPAFAQSERPIRWIVGFAAGGGTDSMARTIGQAMAPILGQTILVENRPGAGGTLGAEAAARAAPDGLTIFSGDSGNMMSAMALFRRLAYDPVRELRGIGLYADFPLVVAVPAASPIRSIQDWFEAARRAGGALPCGHPGVGSPHHLALERLARDARIEVTQVPYRGAAPGVTDLIAGTLGSMVVDIASAGGALRGGQIRALATTHPERWAALPDVPTLREAGLAEYSAPVWQGLVAPAGVPDATFARLSDALSRVMADPAMRARLTEIGVAPRHMDAATFDGFMRSEREFWLPFIRALNISLD